MPTRRAAGDRRKCPGAGSGRLIRPASAPPLSTIRSVAYFLPVIDEVLNLRIHPDYYRYLRHKIERATQLR